MGAVALALGGRQRECSGRRDGANRVRDGALAFPGISGHPRPVA